MAWRRVSPRMARWSSGLLASVAMVAAVTIAVALLERHVPVLSLLVLYLLAVLPAAVLWGARLAALTSLCSIVVFAFLFLLPRGSFRVADSQSAAALGVFLVTAIVVAELAARSRRAAVESARLTEEQSALRRVATLVAQSLPPPAIFEAVIREVGLLSGADLARMEHYERDGSVIGVAAWSRVPVQLAIGTRFDLDGVSVARDVLQRRGPVRLETFAAATGAIAGEARALGIRSSVGCPITVAGRLWGVVAASTTGDDPFPPNTESQIAHFTELVATAIENAAARAELRRMEQGSGTARHR
jgi:K+-sensing histidine kinase KdpD